jgi:hypothetical protein
MPVSTHRVRHCGSSADPLDFIQAGASKHPVPFNPSRGLIDRLEHSGGDDEA